MKAGETKNGHEEFTLEQERVHAALHLLGILFGAVAIPNLLLSANHKDAYSLAGITIYGICFMMVFIFSTLYHGSVEQRRKCLFKKLDRISIYFLIAGTYTPIVKFYVFNEVGVGILWIVWSLVILGILFEIYLPDKFPVVSVTFYLFMGLLFMFVPKHFFGPMPHNIMMLVITGVLFYIAGVVFYVWQRWSYHHAIWHLLVLSGCICHYMAVLYSA